MRPMAWRVGLFALLGTTLLAVATVLVSGGWFAPVEPVLMRFAGSVQGLQAGAPVVFRGVRVGYVTRIGLEPVGLVADAAGSVRIPVAAELEQRQLLQLLSAPPPRGQPVLPALLARGLVARLSTQSLLTGLQLVELDLPPTAPATALPVSTSASPLAGLPAGTPLLPTQAGPLHALQTQLESLDIAQLGRDLSAVGASLRNLLADPRTGQALQRAGDAAQALQSLAQRLERDVAPLLRDAAPLIRQAVPLLREAGATLAESRGAIRQAAPAVARAADQIGQAAAATGAAASQVQGLAAEGRPMVAQVQRSAAELARTAEELTRTAAALRQATGEDSSLRLDAERALQDTARAARALGELAEQLQRQPDALIRGRAPSP